MIDNVDFDQSVYQILRSELGDEDAAEVLRTFLDDTGGKFARLPGKFEDRAEMKREAHSIKSSAATFGFAALSRLSRELELGATTMEPDEMRDLVSQMQQAFDHAALYAESHLLKSGVAAS